MRSIIFFPEYVKTYQIDQIEKITPLLQKLGPEISLFIETTSISKSQIEYLCRFYQTNSLFRLKRMTPARKTIKE